MTQLQRKLSQVIQEFKEVLILPSVAYEEVFDLEQSNEVELDEVYQVRDSMDNNIASFIGLITTFIDDHYPELMGLAEADDYDLKLLKLAKVSIALPLKEPRVPTGMWNPDEMADKIAPAHLLQHLRLTYNMMEYVYIHYLTIAKGFLIQFKEMIEAH